MRPLGWLLRNWFLAGLAAVVAVGLTWPEPGAPGGVLHPALTAKGAVALIFFFQGLSMNLGELRAGLTAWRLHVLVQSFTFVIFPAIGLFLDAIVGRWLPVDLRLGFLFLCVLPTTVSTAVVFTALAGGNTAGAVFNASLSNVLGVLVTPLWTGWLLAAGGRSIALGPVVAEITALLLLPLALGQMVRPVIRRRAEAARPALRHASSGLVLYIVYTAFAGSVAGGVWSSGRTTLVVGTLAGVAVLFAVVLAAVAAGCRMAGLGRPDRIAAFMAAPQKTLASGVPMAQLLFGGHPGLGIILLPLLLYHPLQLVAGGLMVARIAAAGKEQPPAEEPPGAGK